MAAPAPPRYPRTDYGPLRGQLDSRSGTTPTLAGRPWGGPGRLPGPQARPASPPLRGQHQAELKLLPAVAPILIRIPAARAIIYNSCGLP